MRGKFESEVDSGVVDAEIAAVIGDRESTELTQAIVVVHRGKIVAEAYGEGVDSSTTLISWSMAKSITHALVGIAQSEGLLDVAMAAPISQWQSDPRSTVTLQHLLEMRSGLSWVEDYVDGNSSNVIAMLFGAGAQDTAKYAIDQPLVCTPGSQGISVPK